MERTTSDLGLASRAQQLIRLHRPEAAASVLAQAIAAEPTEARLHQLLSQCMIQLQRFDEALQAANDSIRLDPQSEWSFRLRSAALLAKGKRRIGLADLISRRYRRAALGAAKEAVRLGPDQWLPFHELSRVLLESLRIPEALTAAEQAVRRAPNSPQAYNILGLAALRLGRIRGAEVAFRKALQLDPQNSDALNNLGIVARVQGRREEARDLYGASARSNPRSSVGARNAAVMSNTLIGQPLVTAVGLCALGSYRALQRVQDQPLWWVAAIGLVGCALAAYRAWRSVRDTYRPRLLDYSLSKAGLLTAIGIAIVAGIVATVIAGMTAGFFFAGASFALAMVGLGSARQRGKRRSRHPGRVFEGIMLACLLLLATGSLALGLGVALPALLHASPSDALGPTVGLMISLLFAMMFGAGAWGGIRFMRRRAVGSFPLLDELEAGSLETDPLERLSR
jgi:Flp pilus assembly protein TadD